MRVRGVTVGLAALLALRCAGISSVTKTEDTPAGDDRVVSRALDGSTTFRARGAVSAASLEVHVDEESKCEQHITPRVHRVVTTKRTLTSGLAPWTSFIFGGVLAATGASSFFFANGLASSDTTSDPTATSSPVTFQALGVALGIGALVFVTIGIIDAVRYSDSIDDQGVIDGPARVEERACHERPVPSGSPILLRTGSSDLKAHVVNGQATFPMKDVPAADLPLVDFRPMIRIGGVSEVVFVSYEDVKLLHEQLSRDPASRLSMDASARRTAECVKVSDEAKAAALVATSDDAAVDDADRRWLRARKVCDELWTDDLSRVELAAFAPVTLPTLRRIDQVGKNLIARSMQLDRKASLGAAADFGTALDTAHQAQSRCALSQRLKELEDPCKALDSAIASAQEIAARHESELEALRQAAERAAVKKRDAANAKAWRAHFAQCRALMAAVRQVNSLINRGACGDDCLRAVKKMKDEQERLSNYQSDAEISDSDLLDVLRQECVSSQCDVCP